LRGRFRRTARLESPPPAQICQDGINWPNQQETRPRPSKFEQAFGGIVELERINSENLGNLIRTMEAFQRRFEG
jgi:hypothetical protein